jgi:hypothetical protein
LVFLFFAKSSLIKKCLVGKFEKRLFCSAARKFVETIGFYVGGKRKKASSKEI